MNQIQVSGADVSLFHVAARLYGDHTQYWRLLAANSLTDPMIVGTSMIAVPAADPTLTGGLPPQ